MKEIAITGLGVSTSIGADMHAFWNGLLQGNTGVQPITLFDAKEHRNKVGCEIKALRRSAYFQEQIASMGRTTAIMAPALEEALADAMLLPDEWSAYRIGLCIGTTMGEIDPLEKTLHGRHTETPGGPYAIAENVRRLMPLSGPVWTFTNACSAGNFAIARCMDELRLGRADIMIAGGVDSMSWVAFTGFSSLRAMSPDICRPFDRDRKGLILGEGAGVLVLETRAHLEKRKAHARARLLGYGLNCDAHHITQPDPSAKGAVRAMREALAMADISPEQVGYASAHGTGTLANDRMETKAIQAVFHNNREQIKVSSIKGHIGHSLGAASAIEAVMCVKALEWGVFPPTLHLNEIDPQCKEEKVNLIRTVCADRTEVVISNSYAFGGINSSIVLGK